jgi:hypothetical protein
MLFLKRSVTDPLRALITSLRRQRMELGIELRNLNYP